MSRKDYELIAQAISLSLGDLDNEDYQGREAVIRLASRLATALEQENSRFNTTRFLIARGIAI